MVSNRAPKGAATATTIAATVALPEVHLSPNPAADNVTIGITMPAQQQVLLTITDRLGRTLKTIRDGGIPKEYFEFSVAVQDMPSGVYLCRIQTAFGVVSKQLSIIR